MKKSKLRIGSAIFGSLTKVGGYQVFTINLLTGLAKRGHDVTLFVPSDDLFRNKDFYNDLIFKVKSFPGPSDRLARFLPLVLKLFVRFQQKHSKKVAVVFNGDINFSVQYRMNDEIQLTPDSIFVFGTKENLSEINFVESDNVIFDEVEKAIKQNIDLSEIDGISFSEKKVQISIEVEKFTEKIIVLPLNAINVPEGYKIKFYPPKVEIVTTVAFTDYDKLNATLFVAQVDASDLEQKKKLEVTLGKYATFANIVKIKPSRVEFLLIRQ
mgnify:CR=1 FL=1